MNTFTLIHPSMQHRARCGRLVTGHGMVETPVFMPVGTSGSVKGMSPHELAEMGNSILLANAYHLYLRPGHELVRDMGGLHHFMGWDGAILTDSGGFQLYSLAAKCSVTDDGAVFQSHLDGSTHQLTPERSMEIQEALGSDIAMTFDECLAYPATRAAVQSSVTRTTAWARRCRNVHRSTSQALFGIVQGGHYADLRRQSAEEIVEIGFDGYAVGGLSIGEEKSLLYDMIDESIASLPEEAPRYLMGVGLPEDLVEGAFRGVDMFDCVAPTRHGRTGWLYTSSGHIQIRNAKHAREDLPIDFDCRCYTCRTFSRAYLRHLFMSREILGARLNTIHNLSMIAHLMNHIRNAIRADRFDEFRRTFHASRALQPCGEGGEFGGDISPVHRDNGIEVNA